MVIVAFTAIILMYILMYNKSRSLIRTIANTWILVVAFIWAATELLSLFRIYTGTSMLVAWVLLLSILLFLLYKQNVKEVWASCFATNKHFKLIWSEYKIQMVLLSVFAVLILIGSGLHSLNNTDSSIYHLPRIMHWISNQSVWPYATGSDLQIRYPALAEFLVAQIFLMGLPERLASLLQASAFLLSGIMIYGISRRMNVGGKTAFVATFVFYCAPTALAQAFTTQTDNIAAMFLLVYIYFILDFIQREQLANGMGMIRDGVRLAACVMFGFLCKPTICFAMVVFFVWMCVVRIIRRDKLSLLMGYVAVGAITVVLLYVPLIARTYDIYYAETATVEDSNASTEEVVIVGNTDVSKKAGNVLAPDASVIISGSNTPKKVFMTFLMNYCRSSSSAVFPKWNIALNKVVNFAGEKLNYNIVPFAIQEGGGFFGHDTASSPTILIGMAVMCAVLLARRCRLSRPQRAFIICAVVGFVAQCSLMTFTLYRGRYLVGVMAVLCIAFAITVDTLKAKENIKANVMVGMMLIASIGAVNTLSFTAFDIRSGFTGRHVHQYLVNNEWLEKEYVSLFDYINERGYKNIGLYSGFTYEYIVWREIEDLERLEVVNVRYPEYQKYEDINFHPECIIRDNTAEPEETIECHGKTYKLVWSVQAYLSKFAIYVPEEV